MDQNILLTFLCLSAFIFLGDNRVQGDSSIKNHSHLSSASEEIIERKIRGTKSKATSKNKGRGELGTKIQKETYISSKGIIKNKGKQKNNKIKKKDEDKSWNEKVKIKRKLRKTQNKEYSRKLNKKTNEKSGKNKEKGVRTKNKGFSKHIFEKNKFGKGKGKFKDKEKFRKNKSKGFVRKVGQCSRQTDTANVNSTCLEAAVYYMNIIATVIANFDKQKTRMVKQNKIGGSKLGKKELFKPLVDRLVESGGGNKSSLKCYGKAGTPGAKQLANLTTKFGECEKNINASCNPANFPQPNTTKLNACVTATKTFKGSVKGCTKKKGVDACLCWLDHTLNSSASTVKSCTFKKESDAIAKALKSCKKAFSVCRKYEDDSFKSFHVCLKDVDKMKERAKQINENKDAIVKVQETVDNLTKGRKKRGTAASCSEVLVKFNILIQIVQASPASKEVEQISQEISEVAKDVKCSLNEVSNLKGKGNCLKKLVKRMEYLYELILDDIEAQVGERPSNEEIAAVTLIASEIGSTQPTGDMKPVSMGETTHAGGGTTSTGETTHAASTTMPMTTKTIIPPTTKKTTLKNKSKTLGGGGCPIKIVFI